MVDPRKLAAHAQRPGDGRALQTKHFFHFIQQFERCAPFAVELVHKRDDRRVTQATDFHELNGASFDAFGSVDHHQRRVDSRKCAISVLAEIFMARGIKKVHHLAVIGKLHHGGRNGDAALLFQCHPVAGCVSGRLAALHGAGHLDRTAE